jgi:phenylpyruvate tautomerase PptA (4-oxalocrotonate tautomerase family)
MPHLQFEFNREIAAAVKQQLSAHVMHLFSDVMDTGTDHIGITFREVDTHGLALGRVPDPEEGIAFVNADIRAGRSAEQRRRLARGFIDEIHTLCGIPHPNMYVIFTEHGGDSFHLHERVLSSWQAGEAEDDVEYGPAG